MRNNICIVGLSNDFTKTIAKQLADRLDFFYADVNDLLKYDLIDIADAERKSSKAYILKLESSKVKTVASYENTVFTVDYSSLVNGNNYEHILNQTVIVFLKLSKQKLTERLDMQHATPAEKTLELSVFEDRNALISKICNATVLVRTWNETTILKNLLKIVEIL